MTTVSRIRILALVVALAVTVKAGAATFVVNTTADTQDATAGDGICADAGGACSLRAAITEANALGGADVITLPPGTYTETLVADSENLNAGGDFDITSPLTINGAGSGTTIIEANAIPNTASERVIHCTTAATAVVINDVTIRHGNASTNVSGSGIRLETATTNLTLNRVIVTNNRSAGSGGGISIVTAGIVLNVNDSTISANSAEGLVAGSDGRGAGIDVAATATVNITNTIVTGNAISSSVANTFGAGINVSPNVVGATVTITGSTISNNSSTSTAPGGVGVGAGIYNGESTLIIANSSVTGNTASGAHAGVRTRSGTGGPATTNITNCTINDNITSGFEGGGVSNFTVGAFDAITTITGSTIRGNSVSLDEGVAGGIENVSVSTGAATVNLTNSTVSGNGAFVGGGVYNQGAGATVNVNYSTVAANTATGEGGGLYQDTTAGSVTNLKNSIVADNDAATGSDIAGTITSQDFNHVESTDGGTFLAFLHDVTGSDPLLGPLVNNGGPTATHLPMGGSVVLNTITGSDCGTTVTVDQRGLTRPVGAGCEKGAVEVQLPQLANAASRKSHGGTFDINLPLTGTTGVECRSGGSSGNHSLVFTFNNPVVSGSANVTGGTGSVAGSPTFSGPTMTVNLTGVTNAQTITVTLANVTDAFSQVMPSAALNASFLAGDTNGDRFVDAGDASQTRNRSGQATDTTNFRSDVNTDGFVNSGDTTIVRSRSGTSVTAPSPGEHRTK